MINNNDWKYLPDTRAYTYFYIGFIMKSRAKIRQCLTFKRVFVPKSATRRPRNFNKVPIKLWNLKRETRKASESVLRSHSPNLVRHMWENIKRLIRVQSTLKDLLPLSTIMLFYFQLIDVTSNCLLLPSLFSLSSLQRNVFRA